MRLLFLTNLYPPCELGGWEQLCAEIVEAFRARGHVVVVLTSRFRAERAPQHEAYVRRTLFLESDPYHYRPLSLLPHLVHRAHHNRASLRRLITDFCPEVVFIWGMWLLSPQLAALAETLCPGRVAYYFAGYWPVNDFEGDPHTAYWKLTGSRPWVRAAMRPVTWAAMQALRLRSTTSPAFAHVACVSNFVLQELRRRGLPLPAGRVIYNGIDLGKFYYPMATRRAQAPAQQVLRLLFCGSLTRHKGVDVAISALTCLADRFTPAQIQLTIIGAGAESFVRDLQTFVQDHDLAAYVQFAGWVRREEMPARLREHDVMLFPSVWPEPLARAMMEGMAAGLALVSTMTGGSAEFLQDNENALTFAAGDAEALAAQLARLACEPELVVRIAAAGQATALAHFDFNRMADEVEAFVKELT